VDGHELSVDDPAWGGAVLDRGLLVSERVWDGRGDALADARLTTVDGRMADDLRLKLPHFRVMAHVGRQNGRRGWLRISQTELAKRWGMGRTTVSRACNDLVVWGYMMQQTQHEAGESFCQYKIRLDGEDSTSVEAKPDPNVGEIKGGAGRIAGDEGVTGQGGVCATEHTPSKGGSVLPTAHMCAPTEYTGVLPTAHPPYIEHARTDYRRQTPNNTRPPTAVTLREAGEGEDHSRPGLNTWGWKDGWDQAARNAVQDLLATDLAHVATHLLIPVVPTLNPPKGVHGASYVRDLAEMVGRFPPEVLGVVAQALKLNRESDLPATRSVHALARAAAPMAGKGGAGNGAAAPRAGRTAPDTDAWLAALARGDGADPTIALSRQLVQRLGPEVTVAWFAGLEVQRDGSRLRLLLPSPFLARYVANRFTGDILLAARACWPEVAEETLTIAERRSADAA